MTESSANQIESLSSLSENDTKETSFEPIDLSDLTLHYNSQSFHVHAVILSKESKFFEAAIRAARVSYSTSCSLTSVCSEPGHRCLTLPDAPGGSQFTIREFEEFLRHIYDGSLLLSSYVNFDGPPKYEIRLNANTGIYGSLIVNGNQLDVAITRQGNSAPSAFSVRSGCSGMLGIDSFQRIQSLNLLAPNDRLLAFLVKLSHYFQCTSLLKHQEQCCAMLLTEAAGKGQYESLWQLLLLCEACHWKMTNDVIYIVSKDKQFKTRSCWQSVSKSLTSQTLTRLLELMVH